MGNGTENNIAEIYQFADIINNNSDKIERYIKLLIGETKDNLTDDCEEKINFNTIVTDIINESEVFCKTKFIELIISNSVLDAEVIINKDLIERAVINLVKNAVEHTTIDKIIKLNIKYIDNKFVVEIEDFGKGFTSEAFKCAKNQFYTEKSERSGEHYGIGMYFANNVAEKYKGSITYYNKPNQTGAVVVFEIIYG
ncbi:MAG: sensor histidine kinase [Velocimicrobium sp.]